MKLALVFAILIASRASAAPNIPLGKNAEPPELLSQTGLFEGDVSQLKPSADGLSYDINQPLFVDFAKKQRMLYLPQDTHVQFAPEGPYDFPVGTILVKHFRMEISHGVFQNLETRVLVHKEDESWVGYTYKWEGNDARLVDAISSPEVALTIDAGAIGGARLQTFKIPNRKQCLQCHNSSVGFVRSFNTMQLNRIVGGLDQLAVMNEIGLFGHDIGPSSGFDKFAAADDETAPLEKRVKSYVDVNCSHCHNPDPAAMCSFTGLDFRFKFFNVEALVNSGHVVKGSKENSEIFKRMSSIVPGYRMPFIGAALTDPHALDVVGRYIDGL